MSDASDHKKARVRSPAYPAVNLKEAIDRAKAVYRHEKRAAAPVAVVSGHWGLDIKSSGALRLIAALKQFGLLVEEGSGEDRKVRLSDRALDILLAESDESPDRIAAIKAAALSPKIHRMLWDSNNGNLPSDATIKSHLVRKLEFNDAHVDKFIREFRSTIEFAKLESSDIIPSAGVYDDLSGVPDYDENNQQKGQQRRRPVQAGMTEDVLNLPEEGQILIQMPEELSQAGFEDFQTWLELIIRKAKRSIRTEEEHENKGKG